MSKTWKYGLISLGLMVVLVAIFIGKFIYTMRVEQAQIFADPVFETEPPNIAQIIESPSVLVFSKTAGFRHHDAIIAANKLFVEIAENNGWSVFFTENAAVFNDEQLALFDVVVGNSTTGAALTIEQRQAFRGFLGTGGGYVGIHAAGDNSHAGWPWYQNEVIRAEFIGHIMFPQDQFQVADVMTENATHPAMRHLPAIWQHEEEWYSFAASPRGHGVDVLASIDETSYEPGRVAMGNDHPVIWSHPLEQGRVFYSALGHQGAAYLDARYQALLEQAVVWAGRLSPSELETSK